MNARKPPRIAITMGDPAGIGPEIICRALNEMDPDSRARTVLIGDPAVFKRAAALIQAPLYFASTDTPSAEAIAVSAVPIANPEQVVDGRACAAAGESAYQCVVRAVEMARAGEVQAIVTAPLNKAALHAANRKYDGHTGMLAALTDAPSSYMLLASERLSTIHVSTHVSLQEAIRRVQPARIIATARAGAEHMQRLGLHRPRIAVAGLNPHCGEGGIFGDQDDRIIAPAVAAARAQGLDVYGPIPADSVFYRACRGEFDLVVAQYHDQGHIPVKLIAFDTTVNISLGLPIQRTSVDHGTAFDIAWQGRADHTNMQAAIAYAWRMTRAQT